MSRRNGALSGPSPRLIGILTALIIVVAAVCLRSLVLHPRGHGPVSCCIATVGGIFLIAVGTWERKVARAENEPELPRTPGGLLDDERLRYQEQLLSNRRLRARAAADLFWANLVTVAGVVLVLYGVATLVLTLRLAQM